jgi:hypothetical protein
VSLLFPYVIYSPYHIHSPVEYYDVSIAVMHACS